MIFVAVRQPALRLPGEFDRDAFVQRRLCSHRNRQKLLQNFDVRQRVLRQGQRDERTAIGQHHRQQELIGEVLTRGTPAVR